MMMEGAGGGESLEFPESSKESQVQSFLRRPSVCPVPRDEQGGAGQVDHSHTIP